MINVTEALDVAETEIEPVDEEEVDLLMEELSMHIYGSLISALA